MIRILFLLAIPCLAGISVYNGICDASAGVWLGKDLFAVAGDEENVLRVYSLESPGKPVDSVDLKAFIGKDESDLEGVARIGNVLFWIGSHGANKNGKARPNRRVLFATNESLQVTGTVTRNLLNQLSNEMLLASSKLAPEKPGALNIEGLASGPDGKLWIGFRNPVTEAGAAIVSLENPLEGTKGTQAIFKGPFYLPLGGLGIRSLEWNPKQKEFWIVAGSFNDEGIFSLYRWDGNLSNNPRVQTMPSWNGFRPEGLFFTDKSAVFISDDGGKSCNTLKPQFRILQVPLNP